MNGVVGSRNATSTSVIGWFIIDKESSQFSGSTNLGFMEFMTVSYLSVDELARPSSRKAQSQYTELAVNNVLFHVTQKAVAKSGSEYS